MDFFPCTFSLPLALSVHLCFLRWCYYWLWKCDMCHSNTTNFSTWDSLDNAEYMEVEVKWFRGIGMREAKIPWLSGDQHVVPASTPAACDTPPSIKDPFLSFCPRFFISEASCLCYSDSQRQRQCVIVSFQWDPFLLNLIVYVCVCGDVHVLALLWPPFEPISMIALSQSVHLLIQ